MKTYGYIISFILVSFPVFLWAQQPGKRERDWKPSEIYFSTDVVGLSKLAFTHDLHTEYQAKIDFDQFFLALDLGYKDLSTSGSYFKYDGSTLKYESNGDFKYESNGAFIRLGGQMNVIPYNPYRSNIFIGLSYGAARFKDQLNYFKEGTNWNDTDLNLSNNSLKASWIEINNGMNVRIAGPIYIGYMIRLKFGRRLSGDDLLQPYEIPGFGKASRSSAIGFNYYITYRLGFRNKPIPVRPKRVKRLENTSKKEDE